MEDIITVPSKRALNTYRYRVLKLFRKPISNVGLYTETLFSNSRGTKIYKLIPNAGLYGTHYLARLRGPVIS